MTYILFTKLVKKNKKSYFKTENSTICTVHIFYTHVWRRIHLVGAECQCVIQFQCYWKVLEKEKKKKEAI